MGMPMSLYEAFVKEISPLTRGYPSLVRMVCDGLVQTVVLERSDSPALSIVFEQSGKVRFEGKHVNPGAKISSTAKMSYKDATSLILTGMRLVDQSFDEHMDLVDRKAAKRGHSGPRGLDTIL